MFLGVFSSVLLNPPLTVLHHLKNEGLDFVCTKGAFPFLNHINRAWRADFHEVCYLVLRKNESLCDYNCFLRLSLQAVLARTCIFVQEPSACMPNGLCVYSHRIYESNRHLCRFYLQIWPLLFVHGGNRQ